jgi:hypothetical protein
MTMDELSDIREELMPGDAAPDRITVTEQMLVMARRTSTTPQRKTLAEVESA